MAAEQGTEIGAMAGMEAALAALEDDEARFRVLDWVNAKYGGRPSARGGRRVESESKEDQDSPQDKEFPGVGLISESGEFKLTVRDPKANSTNDAAVRLALVTIYVYCKLTGEKTVSSKKVVKPILEEWRAYTGNTRPHLARHRGILRDGDALSLDQHAKREAEGYIEEIRDESITGAWQPTGAAARRPRKGKGAAEE